MTAIHEALGLTGQPRPGLAHAVDGSPVPASLVGGLSEIRSTNLVEVVFQQVRSAILDKSLPPGLRITEDGLARQLNVSKTPVREALLRLRQIGLVEDDGRRGARVVAPSVVALEQAFEIREALEVFAARAAAERGGDPERAAIATAAERSLAGAVAGDGHEFSLWNDAFHERVIATLSNARFANLNEDACALISTLRTRDLPPSEASIVCGTAHIAIAAAITDRDAEAAAARMSSHIRHVTAYVLGALEGVIGEPGAASSSGVPGSGESAFGPDIVGREAPRMGAVD